MRKASKRQDIRGLLEYDPVLRRLMEARLLLVNDLARHFQSFSYSFQDQRLTSNSSFWVLQWCKSPDVKEGVVVIKFCPLHHE